MAAHLALVLTTKSSTRFTSYLVLVKRGVLYGLIRPLTSSDLGKLHGFVCASIGLVSSGITKYTLG